MGIGKWLGGVAAGACLLAGCSDPGLDAGQEWLKSAAETPEDQQDFAQAYGIGITPKSEIEVIQPKDVQVPADVTTQGRFGPVFTWPVMPLHVSLLPDGRVLGYGAGANGQGGTQYYSVWNPALGTGANAIVRLDNTTQTNIFCTGLALQPRTGDVVMFGGSRFVNNQGNYGISAFNIFRSNTNALERQSNDMAFRRWYPSVVTTWDAQQVILGGRDDKEFAGTATIPPTTATYATTPELYTHGVGFKTLTGATSATAFSADYGNWNYPRAWQAPNGKLFLASMQGKPYWIDFTGSGAIAPVAGMPDIPRSFVSLPAVMYQPGRILSLGMNAKATMIDINPAIPTWSATDPPAQLRLWSNATVQADGKVFVNGGSLVNNEIDGASYRSETWDPATGRWTPGALATRMRLYHSVALLMPDATILTASGGAPGPENNNNGEVYYPPYLYKSDGTLAPRPSITSAPTTAMTWNQDFSVGVSAGTTVSRVTFVRAASVTHTFSSDQRFMELPFVQEGSLVHLTTPALPKVAPPGYWLLFVFDGAGVPSVAKIIRIMDTGGGTPPDDPPPDPPPAATLVYDGTSATTFTPILGNNASCDACALNVDAPVISGDDGVRTAKLKFKAVGAATGVYFRNADDTPVRAYKNLKLSVLPTTANLSFRVEVGMHENYKPTGPVKAIVVTAAAANQWNHLSIPMTSYPNAPFNYIAIKAPNNLGSATFYVDNVVLENDTAYTPPAIPGPPTSISATPGSGQVALSWPAVQRATFYNVYQGTSSGGEAAIPVKAGLASTNFTVTGLTNGTTYFFYVRAMNAGGVGPASPEAAATPGTAPGAPPAAPTALSAIGLDREVILDWNTSSGATSYAVYQGTHAGGESGTPVLSGLIATDATIIGLANNTTYYYVVRAVNANGTSAASNEAFATPTAPLEEPTTPAGLVATPGDAQVVLMWSAAAGANTYEVYQGIAAGGEGPVPVKTGVVGTSTTITGLTNGTRYYFVIRAVNTAGTSGASNEASAIPQGATGGVNVYDGTSPGFAVTLGSAVKDCNQCAVGVDAPVISGGDGVRAVRLAFKPVSFATGVFLRAPSPISTSSYASVRLAVYPNDATLKFRLELGSRDERYVQTGPVSNVVVENLVPNQWNSIVVPLSRYKPGLFNYVAVKSANANGTAPFYVDSIVLVP